jgi:hypothetical protein
VVELADPDPVATERRLELVCPSDAAQSRAQE